ncbi:MAG TPA: hypothetical protein VF692_06735 [Pyrinomonadaceae bacterium]|jgi:hypothetical protein
MYSFSLFLVTFLINCAGAFLDIFSSRDFSKYRTSRIRVSEGNTFFNRLFQGKDGNINVKNAVIAAAVVAAVHAGFYFFLPADFGLFANVAGLIIGILRAAFAVQNFSVKKKIKGMMEEEARRTAQS